MARWHAPSCSSSRVWVGADSTPQCSTCGNSAHQQLRKMTKHPPQPIPPLSPDEMPGQLNLSWPSTVSYTRTTPEQDRSHDVTGNQAALLTQELRYSPEPTKEGPLSPTKPSSVKHESSSKRQDSLIHGGTLATDQLRLVCLTDQDNGLPEDVIHISLETYRDGEWPEYEAVSYTWGGEDGDDTLRHPIYVGEYWDILLQTRNCCAMLSYLRPVRGLRMLWVDAICINQQDVEERGDQVAKMDRIYTECFQVVLWLGDDIVSKRPGVYPPRHRLHQLEHPDATTASTREGSKSDVPRRIGICDLLKRRYFSRVWIIQELILPPRVLIPIGDKLFWVDASMASDLQHQTSGAWSWEQTNAPWFQYAAQGSSLVKSLPELLGLSWRSWCSDARDKIYGLLGVCSSRPGITSIRPDYTISLQHTLIGIFAHYIINEGAPQLLLKASGASAEVGMPSWMPIWKGDDAWTTLFGHESEEKPDWDSAVASLFPEMKRQMESEVGKMNFGYRLVRFFPTPSATPGGLRTVFDTRPWYKGATVDADSGAISLNLTRLMPFTQSPVKADPPRKGWYHYHYHAHDYDRRAVRMMSQDNLDTVVEIGDEIFLLDTNLSEPIYLILRKTGKPREFRLIATCPHLVLLIADRAYRASSVSVQDMPLAELQASLGADLARLHGMLDKVLWDSGGSLSLSLFPGSQKDVLLKDVLLLLLAALDIRGSFEETYLDCLDAKCQPQILDGICELQVEAEVAEQLQRVYHESGILFQGKFEGWREKPIAGDTGKSVLSRKIATIKAQLVVAMWGVGEWEWLRPLLRLLAQRGLADRTTEEPVAEDYFRGGVHHGYDKVFGEFKLDGSTYQVRII